MARLADKKQRVSDMVIDEIKDMVRRGALRQGDKLPNQNEFSQQLGVSRPSLREALSQLTRLGVIEQKPGIGTILKAAHPDLWADYPASPVLADSQATLELTEARKSIESVVMEYAVENIAERELKALQKTVGKMETALKARNFNVYMMEDVSFHYQLAVASHNRYITHMFVTIRSLMERFMSDIFVEIPELIPNSFQHHSAILDAVRARDKERAVAEIRNHIEDIHASLMKYYGFNEEEKKT